MTDGPQPPAASPRHTGLRGVASQAAVVAAAMAVGNLLAYTLSVTASRVLGPAKFGALGALLGLLVVGYVAALALQMVTTRRLAATGGRVDPAALTRTAILSSVGLGLVALLLAVPGARFLHLASPLPLVLLAVTCVPMTWSGFVQGLALGRERFGLVAAVALLFAVGKVGGGLAGLLVSPTVDAVMWGTAVGTVLGVGAATALTWRLVAAPRRGVDDDTSREVAHVVHALFALFVFTNLDVLLARHFLTPHAAGLFAAGAIVTKIAFWLPQFVTVVALPRLADHRRHAPAMRASLLATGAVGVATTGFVAAAGALVVALVAGPAYVELSGFVWLFAAEGAAFALAQLLLYGRLSRQDRGAVVAVWAAVVGLVTLVATVGHGSPEAVVVTAASVGALLVGAGLLVERRQSQAADASLSSPTAVGTAG